ncbi:MAG: hypothetical protein Q4B54_03575 [Coriobacteriales bacterium]|nr:hypothetical protein [Coriobacteriales bacterium]
MTVMHTATLSNEGRYTLFQFGDVLLRFIAPMPLERYVEVSKWDRGYLVVMAKYTLYDEPIEEYIDLVPVLENLYMNPDEFCAPIENVEVAYA